MKHTPGPWKIDNSLDAVNEREATGMYQIITERGTVIAETMAEQGADLIAAAPELLEACRTVLRVYHGDNPGMAINVGTVLTDAIKKAGGD